MKTKEKCPKCEEIKEDKLAKIIKDLIATRAVKLPIEDMGRLDFIIKFVIKESTHILIQHIKELHKEIDKLKLKIEIIKEGNKI